MKKNLFRVSFWLIILLAFGLRVYQLGSVPPAPYWEEVALGYDAYSISQTGRDHHGNPWPIVAFESFGDWKPSLYFYAIVPFIWLFDLSVWAVRLPSVLSGVMVVIGVGYLARLLTRVEKQLAEKMQLLAMLLTAISPWAIQFSRAGWEVNLATALIIWGVVFFLQSMEERRGGWKLYLSPIFLVLSMYAYHAARVISPLLGLALALLYLFRKKQDWKKIFITGLIAGVMVLPLATSLGSAQTTQRFAETSLFSELSYIETSNQLKAQAENSFFSRIFYHRYLIYGRQIVSNYLSYFNPNFLFISGDSNPRHSTQWVGTFYYLDVIFLLVGMAILFDSRRVKPWQRNFLLFWLLIGILPAAISKTNPHALRILPTLPVWIIVISLGMMDLKSAIAWPKKIKGWYWPLLGVLYAAQLFNFGYQYLKVYPQLYAREWQVGYEEMVSHVNNWLAEHPGEPVWIDRSVGRPAMYYWFYSQTDPQEVQAQNDRVNKDQGEYLNFNQITFFSRREEIVDQVGLIVTAHPATHEWSYEERL